jgi:RNase H-fold protein (predicted Holliday junction resolvase)
MINKYLSTIGINLYFESNNVRVIYYLKTLFKNKKIYFNIVGRAEDADIIISSNDDEVYNVRTLNEKEITFEPNVDFKKIIQKLFRERSLRLGIDPGDRTGIAVCYGEKLILNEVISPWENAVYFIIDILKEFNCNKKIVKIGCGSSDNVNKLKEILKTRFDDIEIYLIDEKSTTKNAKLRKNQGKEKDRISALKILQRAGRRI